MVTDYQLIYDRFDNKVKSYELDNIFKSSVADYEAILLRYLKSARTKFIQFKKNNNRLLYYIDDLLNQFTIDLDENEQEILASLMVVEFLDREINNLLELRASLNDSDFKRISEANSLRAKMALKDQMKAIVSDLINQYTWYSTYMDSEL